jgi:hypothetical protein
VKKKKLKKIQKKLREQEQNIENLNYQQRWMLKILMEKFQIPGSID